MGWSTLQFVQVGEEITVVALVCEDGCLCRRASARRRFVASRLTLRIDCSACHERVSSNSGMTVGSRRWLERPMF
jgi:hypothetical protein